MSEPTDPAALFAAILAEQLSSGAPEQPQAYPQQPPPPGPRAPQPNLAQGASARYGPPAPDFGQAFTDAIQMYVGQPPGGMWAALDYQYARFT
jgi:hypothetical protein